MSPAVGPRHPNVPLAYGTAGFRARAELLDSTFFRMGILAALRSLDPGGDASDDINAERRYFSYEHFYVLFCAFCRLDDDRDGLLSLRDLQRYGNFGLSGRIAQRVFDTRRCARAIIGQFVVLYFFLQRHVVCRAVTLSVSVPRLRGKCAVAHSRRGLSLGVRALSRREIRRTAAF